MYTFNLWQAMVMTHTQAKHQGKRSVGLEDIVETNGWMDMTDHITFPTNRM